MKSILSVVVISALLFLAACQQQADMYTPPANDDADTVYCTQEYDPVCGSNGVTYSNRCMAGQAGIMVAYAGECKENAMSDENDREQPRPEAEGLGFTSYTHDDIHHSGAEEQKEDIEMRDVQANYSQHVNEGRTFQFYQ